MARSTILPLAAAAVLAASAAIATAAAQTTTTTTTTTTRDGSTTVTRETTVLGEPTVPAPAGTVTTAPVTGTTTGPATGMPGETSVLGEPAPAPQGGTGSTVRTLGTVTMPAPAAPAPTTPPMTTAPTATAPVTTAPGMTGAATTTATGQPDMSDPILTQDGLRYACTGIGLDARQDPRWRDFSTKLMFTVEGGGYLPDVLTRITDGQGRQVFAERCDGPWLLVDLPAGHYSVVATAQDPSGRVHEHTASISAPSSGQRQEIIRFPEMPK